MLSLRFYQSIQVKLVILFMIAGAIPMIVSMAVSNKHSQQLLITKAEDSLLENARTRQSMLNDHIEGFKTSAKVMANLPSVNAFMSGVNETGASDDAIFREVGLEVAQFQRAYWGDSHHMFVVDTQGTVVLSPPKVGWDIETSAESFRLTQSDHAGESIADSRFFEQALEGPLVTDFFGFEERDHYHQLISHPIRDEYGVTTGIVAVEVSIQGIDALMNDEFSIGETGRIYVATSNGLRVVHKKENFDSMPIKGTGVLQAASTREPVSGWYEPEPEHDVLGVYLASPIYPWVVCIEVDQEEVFKPLRAQQRRFLVLTVSSLVVLVLSVTFVGRLFSRPLRVIASATQRVADGDLLHPIPRTRADEIGQLESAVDSMRVSLKDQIHHLDAQVNARTTQLEELNADLKYDTEHDRLTGLANRKLFGSRIKKEFEQYKEDPEHLISVLFFDFDRFKVVNDSLGHAAGDALLCSIAERFTAEMRETDLVARFGGDEFVVLLSPVETQEHARMTAHRLLKIFERPHILDGHRIVSTASIGLVIADPRYNDADDMVRDADAAMYEAKLAGKGQVVAFDHKMFEDATRRLELEEYLSDAVANNELRVHYQPIMGMEDMKVVGFEALIRWEHPTLGMVRPDHFISIAEDTRQIVNVGAWILRESVEQMIRWDDELGLDGTLSINVNVAKTQLIHPGFFGLVKDVLETTGFEPSRLKIEITESTAIDPRHDMSMVIQKVRQLGIRIAMDDFGTGHSSLSLLHQFEFDILKIDQSFVQGMEDSRELGAVLHSIIVLAQNTGMKVVAEGVETESQVACLISHECDMVQGYYFSKPLPTKEAGEFLRNPPCHRKAA